MSKIETPEEILNNHLTEQTKSWKDFANEELNDLKNARETMCKIYRIEKEEIEEEKALRKFMINAITKVDETITKIDETITKIDEKYPYLKDKQPEEMLKDALIEDIKEIKELNATVRQFSNANANQPKKTPFKDALYEYMQEYLENIKNLRKTIKTIWDKK